MSYLCIYNSYKECDGCNECRKSKKVICPVCGVELINGDELYFQEYSDGIIGCTHCVYTQYVEDYETD